MVLGGSAAAPSSAVPAAVLPPLTAQMLSRQKTLVLDFSGLPPYGICRESLEATRPESQRFALPTVVPHSIR